MIVVGVAGVVCRVVAVDVVCVGCCSCDRGCVCAGVVKVAPVAFAAVVVDVDVVVVVCDCRCC